MFKKTNFGSIIFKRFFCTSNILISLITLGNSKFSFIGYLFFNLLTFFSYLFVLVMKWIKTSNKKEKNRSIPWHRGRDTRTWWPTRRASSQPAARRARQSHQSRATCARPHWTSSPARDRSDCGSQSRPGRSCCRTWAQRRLLSRSRSICRLSRTWTRRSCRIEWSWSSRPRNHLHNLEKTTFNFSTNDK